MTYPYICKSCGYEVDFDFNPDQIPDKVKCPDCGEIKMMQNYGKKFKQTNTIIPQHMRANSSEGTNPFRKGYGKKKKEIF